MNAILQKLERKYQKASPVAAPGPFLGDDENRGGEAGQVKGDGTKPIAEKTRPESWKDSETVSLLSAFMTEYASQGFYLCQGAAGCPVLHMEPGVSPEDPERWDVLLHAEHLMAEALTDLTYLLETGALTLKLVKEIKAQIKAPDFSPEQSICCTTVPDAILRLKAESSVKGVVMC